MGFRNVPAALVSSGTFTGTYTLPGLLTINDPVSGGRIELGHNLTSGKRGARLYAGDGVTVLVDLDTTDEVGRINGGEITGSTVTGGVVQTSAATNVARALLDGSTGSVYTKDASNRKRAELAGDSLLLYSGEATELVPAYLTVDKDTTDGNRSRLQVSGNALSNDGGNHYGDHIFVCVFSGKDDGTGHPVYQVLTNKYQSQAYLDLIGNDFYRSTPAGPRRGLPIQLLAKDIRYARTNGVYDIEPQDIEEWHLVGSGGTEPAFSGLWANLDASHMALRFRINSLGSLEVKGVIKTTGNVNPASTIFTLPTEYIPDIQMDHPVVYKVAGGTAVVARGYVNAAGAVGVTDFPAATTFAHAVVNLEIPLNEA